MKILSRAAPSGVMFIPSFTEISLQISVYNIHVRILTRGQKNNGTHTKLGLYALKERLPATLQRVTSNSNSKSKVIFNQTERLMNMRTHLRTFLSFYRLTAQGIKFFCACARTGSYQNTQNYRLQQVITSNYLSWRLFLVTATAHSNFLMKCQIHCNKTKCRHDQHTQETGYDNDEVQ